MHFHATQVSASGDGLAGFQAAQTAMALRRARELRDAATRMKAGSREFQDVEPGLALDSESAAQSVSMIAAWAGGGGSGQSARDGQSRHSSSDSETAEDSARIRAASRTDIARPVSFWA